MWVAVHKSGRVDLAIKTIRNEMGDVTRAHAHVFDGRHVPNATSLLERHGQDPRGRQVRENIGDANPGIIFKQLAAARCVRGLLLEVEFNREVRCYFMSQPPERHPRKESSQEFDD
jgi:hypothetical protein